MSSNQAQIESDAALARRLQEEEFSQVTLPRLPFPPQQMHRHRHRHPHPLAQGQPHPQPHPQSHPPSQSQSQGQSQSHPVPRRGPRPPPPSRTSPPPHQPHYPQPATTQQRGPHPPQQQMRFPFARGNPDFETVDMLHEMLNRVFHNNVPTRAFDSLHEFGLMPPDPQSRGEAGPRVRRPRNDDVLSQIFGDEFMGNGRFTMSTPTRTIDAEFHTGSGNSAMDMMGMLISGAFQPIGGGMGAMAGGGISSIGDMMRAFMQGGEGGETYEDWLNMIERMGGNVNRGATDDEVGQLDTHIYEKKKKTGGFDQLRSAAGPSGLAGPSSGVAGPSSMTETTNRASANDDEEDDKCAICLGEYEEGEEIKQLPCRHMFHGECVSRWLKLNRICPVCKHSIREGDGASE